MPGFSMIVPPTSSVDRLLDKNGRAFMEVRIPGKGFSDNRFVRPTGSGCTHLAYMFHIAME